MKRLLVGVCLVAAAALAQAPVSRKTASLDLVHPKARGSFPRGLRCPDPATHPTGDLALTVAPLDKSSYSPGDEIVYKLRIENAGAKAFSIPWSPDPGVLPKQRDLDRYTVSTFRVAAFSPCGRANFPATDLYADPSAPGSWLELKPHQYAEVTLATRVQGLASCSDSAPTPVQLRITMAQSAPAHGKGDFCTISFFKGYHVQSPLEIMLAPPPPPLKKAKGK